MPVYEQEEGRRRYFYITKAQDDIGNLVGRLASRTSETDPLGVKHTNEEGRVTYRHYYPSIGGILTGIEISKKEGKKGPFFSWELSMDGGMGETFVLSINMKSSSANSIMHRIPSCNLKEEIKFTPYYFGEKEKIITVIHQRDAEGKWQKIAKFWAYDQETGKMTNGMPDLKVEEDSVTGEKKYDDKEQNAFMWNYYKEKILPVLAENAEASQAVRVQQPAQETPVTPDDLHEDVHPAVTEDITEDDLPF